MELKSIFDIVKADRYTQDGRDVIVKAQTEDRRYKTGEISEKTGLQKQPDGSWAPPKSTKYGKVTTNKEGKVGIQQTLGKGSKFEEFANEKSASRALANLTAGYNTTERSKEDPHSDKARQVKHWDKETNQIKKENRQAEMKNEVVEYLSKKMPREYAEKYVGSASSKLLRTMYNNLKYKIPAENKALHNKEGQRREEAAAGSTEPQNRAGAPSEAKQTPDETRKEGRELPKPVQKRDSVSAGRMQKDLDGNFWSRPEDFREDITSRGWDVEEMNNEYAVISNEAGSQYEVRFDDHSDDGDLTVRTFKPLMVDEDDDDELEDAAYTPESVNAPREALERKLTGDTKIRLGQVTDKVYQIGEISQKTGLQKTANGWVKPKTGAETAAKQETSGEKVDRLWNDLQGRIKTLRSKGYSDEQIDNDPKIKSIQSEMKAVGQKTGAAPR